MNANVRKLALDLGFRWLMPFQLLLALAADYLYLLDSQLNSVLGAGIILALQGTSTNAKVALWHTLPMTDLEVGRGRWWQMVGLPGLGIVVMMGVALALHALMAAIGGTHPLRPDTAAIARALLLQFFYPVFLTVFTLATTFARTRRSPFAYAAAIAVWAPWLLLLPHSIGLPADTRFLLLGAVGALVAVLLYLSARHWPEPVTLPMQLDMGGGDSGAGPTGLAGQGGWTSLCLMGLMRPALGLGAITLFWIVATLALDLRHIMAMQVDQFIPFIVILAVTQLNAVILRLLRALPGSALKLTAYLYLQPLGLLAAASCTASLILLPWTTQTPPQFDGVALAAMLMVSALILPGALGLRQVAMSMVLVLTLVAVPMIQFGWHYVPAPWGDERLLMALAMVSIGIGFFWMRAQISRGSRVYRFQPFVPARWRGKD